MKHMIIFSVLCLSAMTLRAQDTTSVQQNLRNPGARIREVSICNCQPRPVNNSPGLNSLRARLANPSWNGRLPAINTGLKLEDGKIKPLASPEERTDSLITVPVYVFFPLAGFRLRNPEQGINVNAMADLAIAMNLRVRITGAADSAIGTPEKNEELALERAEYIASLMKNRGVREDQIEIFSDGGVSTFEPVSANRNCRIELFINPGEE